MLDEHGIERDPAVMEQHLERAAIRTANLKAHITAVQRILGGSVDATIAAECLDCIIADAQAARDALRQMPPGIIGEFLGNKERFARKGALLCDGESVDDVNEQLELENLPLLSGPTAIAVALAIVEQDR